MKKLAKNTLFIFLILFTLGCNRNDLENKFLTNSKYFEFSVKELSKIKNHSESFYYKGSLKNPIDSINSPNTKEIIKIFDFDIIASDQKGNIYYQFIKPNNFNDNREILIFVLKKPVPKNIKIKKWINQNWAISLVNDFKF